MSRFVRFSQPVFDRAFPFIAGADFHFPLWGTSLPITLWYWPEGHGYTGQESLEIHLPGSAPLLDRVLQTLCHSKGIRMANPGEFTFRAFYHGRLDLTQAEAVLGVIDASDDHGLEVALNQLAGNLGSPLRTLRTTLLETLVHLEAGFDFSDENINFISRNDILSRIEEGRELIHSMLSQMKDRVDYRQKCRIILTGPANAGKSSLFNRLSAQFQKRSGEYDDAIVSEIAGTTRDYLEREISLKNGEVLLVDTAGIDGDHGVLSDLSRHEERERSNWEELLGKLTEQALLSADLTFYCLEADSILRPDFPLPPPRADQFVLVTKVDRLSKESWDTLPVRDDLFPVSSLTGTGLEQLISEADRYLFKVSLQSEIVPATTNRCRCSFEACRDALSRAYTLADQMEDDVLLAYELRTALNEIGAILGEVQADEILDSIFSRFCIGK